jgi:hypothetical protein
MLKSPCTSCLHFQALAFADDVNMLGESIQTVQRNTAAIVPTCKEIGLEVNAEKTKYMVMSQEQNAGQNHNIKIGNKSLERVEQFKYLGTTLTGQNSIREEIKCRLKSGNACYHLMQCFMSSILLCKNWAFKG